LVSEGFVAPSDICILFKFSASIGDKLLNRIQDNVSLNITHNAQLQNIKPTPIVPR
jgi:hypothetical protein